MKFRYQLGLSVAFEVEREKGNKLMERWKAAAAKMERALNPRQSGNQRQMESFVKIMEQVARQMRASMPRERPGASDGS
jgi:flagellar biosynthesis/type III secretory pathway protein FliH